jgi:hypothetical protein
VRSRDAGSAPRCLSVVLHEPLAQAPPGKTCLSLTSRVVSSQRRKRRYRQDSSRVASPRREGQS